MSTILGKVSKLLNIVEKNSINLDDGMKTSLNSLKNAMTSTTTVGGTSMTRSSSQTDIMLLRHQINESPK